mgnify:CR=1 FL=1
MKAMSRTENAEFTNMCMIYDDEGNVLVQNRKKSWCGLAFPGGHLEPKESIVDSVIREVKEETGLDICELKLCGIKQAFPQQGGRFIVFLYKTNKFKGELKSNGEGENSWIKLDDLIKRKDEMANNFEYMLQVFLNDEYSEHYHLRNDDGVIDLLK